MLDDIKKKIFTDDSMPLFSQSHKLDSDFTTRIQIGKRRFNKLEKLIDWFRLRFIRPKMSSDNFIKYKELEDRTLKEYDNDLFLHLTSYKDSRKKQK